MLDRTRSMSAHIEANYAGPIQCSKKPAPVRAAFGYLPEIAMEQSSTQPYNFISLIVAIDYTIEMTDFVHYEQAERVVTLTLNRPEERNAFGSHEFCAALVEAVERANADALVSCVILTGAGSAFCTGGNVKRMRDTGGIGLAANPA